MTTILLSDRRVVSALAGLLAIVAFVALNIWVDQPLRNARIDLTRDGIYSISEGTRSVLSSIREPITLRFYESDMLDALGPDYLAHAKHVDEFLQEYVRLSKGMVRVERLKPTAFSVEEDLAFTDGIQGIPDVAQGVEIFFGVAGTNSTNGRYVLPHLPPERANFLEYDLTRLVHDLAIPRKTVIGLMGDLPMHGDRTTRTPPWAVLDAVQRFFEVRPLFGQLGSIDEDIDIIWLVEPGGLDEPALYALDQFVMRGGRVLAFIDPFSEFLATRSQAGTPEPRRSSVETLDPLLRSWGVEIPFRTIMGDRPGALQVQMQRDDRIVVTDYLAWFELDEKAFSKNDLTTAQLGLMQFRTAGEIRQTPGATTRVEALIQTSVDAGPIDVSKVEYAPDPTHILAVFQPGGERHVIAARVTGPARSAFPGGPPESVETLRLGEAHRTVAEEPVNLILVADSDLLVNDTWMESQPMAGKSLAVPFANNADFVVNALDTLYGSSAMVGLRGRGIVHRGFTVLRTMEQRSEQLYRAKEHVLRDKLRELQHRITGLQKGNQDQGLILTTEQQSSIEATRTQMLNLRAELREVRFELRREVTELETLITRLNIWLVPGFVAGFAVIMAGWRTYRSRRHLSVVS